MSGRPGWLPGLTVASALLWGATTGPDPQAPSLERTAAQPAAGVIRIRFVNDESGLAEIPGRVSLVCGKVIRRLEVDRSGRTSAPMSSRGCIVDVEQYDPRRERLISVITILLDGDATIYVRSLKPTPELDPAAMRKLAGPNAVTVVGFVVDDETSEPVAGAVVGGASASARTNARGFYQLAFKPPAKQPAASAAVDLACAHPGYRREFRGGAVELMTGIVPIHNFRLVKPSSAATGGAGVFQLPPPQSSPPKYPRAGHKFVLPGVIRVGTGCKGLNCAAMTYLDLEDYTRRVLAAEWPATAVRRNVTQALMAGAVAIRSYGLAYARRPYICSTTVCQVLNGRRYVETDMAVRATQGIVLMDGDKVAQAEYAAETNDMGCGDGFGGEDRKGCIREPLCRGKTGSGHGRGMCQNGSVAWAMAGTDGKGNKVDWKWLLAHYYPTFALVPSMCDVNDDFLIDRNDVQAEVSKALGAVPCGPEADLDGDGRCTVVDLQRVVNAVLSGASCRAERPGGPSTGARRHSRRLPTLHHPRLGLSDNAGMRTRVVWMLAGALALQAGPRARDLGIPLDGTTGPLNAITDVAGVEVGLTTLIEGESVRTGVTVVLPRGKASNEAVFAGWHSLNGNGEMTGTTWIEESGLLEGPVAITNTHSVGVVRDALVAWGVRRQALQQAFSLPVVAETWDGWLNDANGFHVRPEHVFAALEKAAGGAVAEGNTGGGTGMICYRFKGGTGTASRRAGRYTLGVLVQANFGLRAQLTVAGVPVGRELNCARYPCRPEEPPREGSIIAVAATDAPLLPHQLKRLARRVSLGLARTGSVSTDSSGDIFIAFSTANRAAAATAGIAAVNMLPNPAMNPLFEAVVEATEEAVLNAMLAAGTMTGRNGLRVAALPHDALREALRKYNRLRPQPAAQ